MRIEPTVTIPPTLSRTTYNCNGSVKRTYTNNTGSPMIVRAFKRSDVIKNKPDVYGFRPPSPYEFELIENDFGGFHSEVLSHINFATCATKVSEVNTGSRYFIDGAAFTARGGSYVASSQTRQLVIQRALSDLKNQKVNLAMTLAFSRETASMVSQAGRRLSGAYRALKQRDPAHALRELGLWRGNKSHKQNAASMYLEALFGWAQLADDVMGTVEHMNSASKRKFQLVYGRNRVIDTYDQSRGPLSATSGWSRVGADVYQGSSRTTNKAVAIGRVMSEGMQNLASLGFTNPAEVIWDVVPWSWVINQFVAVGDYLSAYDATAGLEYLGGSHTLYQEYSGSHQLVSDYRDKNGYEPIGSGFTTVHRRKLTRTTFDASDISLTVRNPFKTSLLTAGAVTAALVNTLSEGPFDRSIPYRRLKR